MGTTNISKTTTTIKRYLNRIGVRGISSREIYSFVERHPLGSSVRCVNDFFNTYNISAIVCGLGINQLTEIESPLLTIIKREESLVTIERIDKSGVVVRGAGRPIKYSLAEFQKIWTGVVLGAESGDEIKTPPYYRYVINQVIYHTNQNIPTIIGLSLMLLLLLCTQVNPLSRPFYLLFTLIGWFASLLAVRKILSRYSLLDQMCRAIKIATCDNVLNSDASKLFGWVNLSELSLAYFSSILALLLFMPIELSLLYSFLGLLSIPVLIFSIVWQSRKKKMCVACVLIDIALIGQLIAVGFIFREFAPTLEDLIYLIKYSLVFISILLFIYLVRAYIQLKQRVARQSIKRQSLISTPNLFDTILSQSRRVEPTTDYAPINNGVESDYTVTVITNIDCPMCVRVHKVLKDITTARVEIIFLPSSPESNTRVTQLVAVAREWGWDKFMEEIGYYHKNKFFKSKCMPQPNDDDKRVVVEHLRYCTEVRISGTPTLLVNNCVYPEVYEYEDLKLLI